MFCLIGILSWCCCCRDNSKVIRRADSFELEAEGEEIRGPGGVTEMSPIYDEPKEVKREPYHARYDGKKF